MNQAANCCTVAGARKCTVTAHSGAAGARHCLRRSTNYRSDRSGGYRAIRFIRNHACKGIKVEGAGRVGISPFRSTEKRFKEEVGRDDTCA